MARRKRKEPPRALTRGERNIGWIEEFCRIPDGPNVGAKVVLREWQRGEIKKIYDNPAGTRRAIISFGRKNAKSTLCAFLLLLHLVGLERRRNSQLFSSAQSREQAALVFNLAAKIIRMSPRLRGVVVVKDSKKELLCPELGTLYRALSAEVATSYGLNPVFIVHDELGQVRGPIDELYEALETATGVQDNPLSIIISTQAPSDNDLLSILIDDAKAKNDPRVTLSLFTAPMDADAFTEETVKQANPAFGDFLNPVEVMGMAEDARRMPARESEFRNLVLNQRVEQSNPFVKHSTWQDCAVAPIEPEQWGKAVVYGGLDLSSTQDLTALVLMAKIGSIWQVKPTFWLPEDGLEERSRLDHVPYSLWFKRGYLRTTPGKAVEYEFIAAHLREVLQTYNIAKIGFDRWNFDNLRSWMVRSPIPEQLIDEKFVKFGQGYQSMSPALLALETMILTKRIAHGDHPVLSMCAAHAVLETDSQNNRKLNKKKSRKRIDGMVALTMACGLAEKQQQPTQYKIQVI